MAKMLEIAEDVTLCKGAALRLLSQSRSGKPATLLAASKPAALKFVCQGPHMKSARSASFFQLFLVSVGLISLLLMAGCGQMVATSSIASSPTPTPTPAITNPNNFVYVSVYDSSTVEGFKIDPAGNVSAIPGSPFAVPEGPIGLTRNQDFLFVGSDGINVLTPDKDMITSYRIDPATGALTKVASLHTGIPLGLSVDPAGKFLYMPGVDVFTITPTGQLMEIPGAPFGSPSSLVFVQADIVFHPSAKFLYSSGFPDGHGAPGPFAIFASVDLTSGVPSNGQMLGPRTTSLAITPDGKFMVASTGPPELQNQLCTYTIDPITGAPSGASLGGKLVTPVSCATTAGFQNQIALNPDGTLVAVTGADGVSMFRLSNGTLSQIAGSPVAVSTPLSLVSFSRDGKYLFVAGAAEDIVNPNHQVIVFQVNTATGALTQASGSPFNLSAAPARLVP